jgi:hypothetical protein
MENALHKRTHASGKTFAPDLLVRVLEGLIEKREVVAIYMEKFGGEDADYTQSLRQETRTRWLL